jgi:hypothetical protein
MRVLVIFAILATAFALYAEKLPIDIYELPVESIPADSLFEKDGLAYYTDMLFTGVAYERYNKEQLKLITTYKKGLPHGPSYEWYEDGQTLISANYIMGRLYGQYLAWYSTGDIIYNLVFKKGKLNYDSQFESDDSREESLSEQVEQDSEGNKESTEK